MRSALWVFATMILVLVIPTNGFAESSFNALYARGNQHFEAGDFVAARDAYSTIIKQGGIDASVLYNLGNCYLKLTDIGHAILCYRQALRIEPGDEDILSNLTVARSLVREKIDIPAANGLYHWFVDVSQFMGIRLITVVTAVFWVISSVVLIIATMARRKRIRRKLFRGTFVSVIIFVVFAGLLFVLINEQQWTEYAVAVGSPVIARNGPGEHFTEVYQQHPGYEMKIKRRQAGWVEVLLANGYTAWVPNGTIENI
ncbi:tetratricopeptide repeat protein [bacterium]|nr:tetratricopeptide repeat protein [bacterium]